MKEKTSSLVNDLDLGKILFNLPVKLFWGFALIVLFTFYCAAQNGHSKNYLNHITVEEDSRSYYLYIPKSIDQSKSFPLLFAFHGYGSSALNMFGSQMNAIADNECFAVCYPQGIKERWNVGGKYFENGKDDILFVRALIDEISKTYSINAEAIFAYGMSNGGFMSYNLACELSDKIRAIASVTGSMTQEQIETCNPEKIIPILQIHGTNDQTVPYLDTTKKYCVAVKQTLNFWSKLNNCSRAKVNELYKSNCDKRQVMISKPEMCTAEVKLINVKNGVHQWFCFSNQEIWWFFEQYITNSN